MVKLLSTAPVLKAEMILLQQEYLEILNQVNARLDLAAQYIEQNNQLLDQWQTDLDNAKQQHERLPLWKKFFTLLGYDRQITQISNLYRESIHNNMTVIDKLHQDSEEELQKLNRWAEKISAKRAELLRISGLENESY